MPFKLISNTGASTIPGLPQDHYCIKNARFMAQAHNTIFRALNAIYQQALNVVPGTKEAADLLEYCSITYDFMHHHQLGEENTYFPEIEQATGVIGLMEINITEHHNIDVGIEKLRRYAETTRKEAFNGEELRKIIDEFAGPYQEHQNNEIKTILQLHTKIDSRTLNKIDLRTRKEAERQADVFKYIIISILLHD